MTAASFTTWPCYRRRYTPYLFTVGLKRKPVCWTLVLLWICTCVGYLPGDMVQAAQHPSVLFLVTGQSGERDPFHHFFLFAEVALDAPNKAHVAVRELPVRRIHQRRQLIQQFTVPGINRGHVQAHARRLVTAGGWEEGRAHRYTITGNVVCASTFWVSLPTSRRLMPLRPCEAMKMTSQPRSFAVLVISS